MSKSQVFDCFTFFNELDILEIRLAELDPFVDYFVIVEATRTFTGKPKPLYYADNRERYRPYAEKIIHIVVDDLPLDTPSYWVRESHQRDAIMRGLTQADPNDRVIISDCDEIPKPELLQRALQYRGLSHRIVAFWCDNYFYRFNLRNDTHDHRLGPRLLTMSNLRSPQKIREIQFRFSKRRYLAPLAEPVAAYRILRRLRTFLWPTIIWNGAWHFTCMGDLATVNLKLSSFSHADDWVNGLTEEAYQHQLLSLKKSPLTELPHSIQKQKFASLIS